MRALPTSRRRALRQDTPALPHPHAARLAKGAYTPGPLRQQHWQKSRHEEVRRAPSATAAAASIAVGRFRALIERLLALQAEPKQRRRHDQHRPHSGVEGPQQLRLHLEEQELCGGRGGAVESGA